MGMEIWTCWVMMSCYRSCIEKQLRLFTKTIVQTFEHGILMPPDGRFYGCLKLRKRSLKKSALRAGSLPLSSH